MAGLLEIYSLGGCGGFGMNAALFAAEGRGLLVDFGIGFPRTALPGVALTVPDASQVAERVPDLAAVVLTHAHDDHCAGLPYLPPRWNRAPVYGPGLALATAADRLLDTDAPLPRMHPVPLGHTVTLGPFRVTFVAMTHSVPDTALLAIDTPAGLVVHSSDFKIDRSPLRGPEVDFAALHELGRRGVRLMLVDSTGARREGRAGSESSVAPHIEAAVREATGQVVVSSFASHLHRIEGALAVAARTGRRAALLGQRMQRTVRHGIDLGLFDAPAGVLVSPEDLDRELPERRMWLAGGCQGEPQSSLARLSAGTDPRAEVERGDVVIVSASVVPGNEMPVGRMLDRFLRMGAAVRTTETDPGLHVSGHGGREEIGELLTILRPEIVVPLHGDRAHLEAAAALAEATVPAPRQVVIIEKGDRLELTGSGVRMTERLELYTTYLDDAGLALSPAILRERQQIGSTGMAVVQIRRRNGALTADSVRIEGLGIPGWETIAPQAASAALEAVRRAPAWTPVADLEADLARRVGNLLRRGNRYRPRVVVFLD